MEKGGLKQDTDKGLYFPNVRRDGEQVNPLLNSVAHMICFGFALCNLLMHKKVKLLSVSYLHYYLLLFL